MIDQLTEYLSNVGEKEVAISLLDALGKHSTTFQQFDEVAKSYFKIKQYLKALNYAEKALASVPGNSYEAKYNVINVANHANYPERAMTLIKQLEIINPHDVDLRLEKAFSLFLLNRKSEAEKILREELENPKNNEEVKTKIRFNLGTYELLRDEFQSGLRKFLFEGRKLDYWKKPQLPFEAWNGNVEIGRTIYVRTEAGIGDEFINVRFMNHLAKIGMKPIWYSERKDISKIFCRCGYRTVNSVSEIDISENPCWVHSMDLPVMLNLEYEDLWHGAYLSSNPQHVLDEIKPEIQKLIQSRKIKIGIRWQGNPSYDQDLHRSIPFESLFSTVRFALPEAEIFSLQRDTGLEEMEGHEDKITRLDMHMHDYEDTLKMMDHLDLVITSCTSIGHASAAMGKNVVIITPISAYYTWCHSTEKSPWYGENLTLLRQQRPRTWQEPLDELGVFLNEKFAD
jgi:tetratricopeptide (TPR) repeat protein